MCFGLAEMQQQLLQIRQLHIPPPLQFIWEIVITLNPGVADIAAATCDSENGRFELTGQVKQFDQSGS